MEPARDHRAFLLGDLRDVAQRHDPRHRDLLINPPGVQLDARRRVQQHARLRLRVGGKRRHRHVAAHAPLRDDRLHLGKAHRRRRHRRRRTIRPGPPRRDSEQPRTEAEELPRVDALVLAVEEMPDRHRRDRDQQENRPVMLVPVSRRIVVADHDENHGQREIVVVDAALFPALAVDRIGQPAGAHRLDHLLLSRDDHKKHVGRHDRADRRTHVDVGRAPAEPLAQRPRQPAQQNKHHRTERPVAFPQGRAAQRVVDEPRQHHAPHADADRLRARDIRAARIDHRRLRVQPIHEHQQRRAREPRRVGLPLEPMQLLRQRSRRDRVFLRVIKPAAMHGPKIARDAFLGVLRTGRRRFEAVVEPDEIERRTDPRHAGDDVQPPHEHPKKFHQMSIHKKRIGTKSALHANAPANF